MRELFGFFVGVRGNLRASLWTEPMWGIPFHLFWPFFTVYMFHLGVLDAQIGLLLALGRLLMVFSALLGGIITDKFGRRLTTLIGDVISWSIPVAIWMVSQNFWWFLAAALIHGMVQVSSISWECLWIDDISEDGEKIKHFFNWLYISGLLAVFFAPIAGIFIARHSLVPVVRVLLGIAFVSMTAKFIIMYVFTTETERGKERMKATKNIPFSTLLLGYKEVFMQVIKSKNMRRALSLQSLIQVTLLVSSTFFALYVTQNIGLPDEFLAYFPILRSAVMLMFLFFIQNRLYVFGERRVMFTGIGLFLASLVVLLVSPEGNWVLPAIYIFIEACAAALLLPRIDTLAANSIDPKERARIRSLFNMVILAVVSPFAYFAGVLSEMDRRLPFVLNACVFIIMIFFIAAGRNKQTNASAEDDSALSPS